MVYNSEVNTTSVAIVVYGNYHRMDCAHYWRGYWRQSSREGGGYAYPGHASVASLFICQIQCSSVSRALCVSLLQRWSFAWPSLSPWEDDNVFERSMAFTKRTGSCRTIVSIFNMDRERQLRWVPAADAFLLSTEYGASSWRMRRGEEEKGLVVV